MMTLTEYGWGYLKNNPLESLNVLVNSVKVNYYLNTSQPTVLTFVFEKPIKGDCEIIGGTCIVSSGTLNSNTNSINLLLSKQAPLLDRYKYKDTLIREELEYLPTIQNNRPLFVVSSPNSQSDLYLAYNGGGIYAFDKFPLSKSVEVYVEQLKDGELKLKSDYQLRRPWFYGEQIVQIIEGPAKGLCRYVETLTDFEGTTYCTVKRPLEVNKLTKARLYFLGPTPFEYEWYSISNATKERLGVVQIGKGLSITKQGLLNLALDKLVDYVLSVNKQTGHVVLDLDPLIKTVNNVPPDANGNITLPDYILPPATIQKLGGVIVGNGLKVTKEGVLTSNTDALVTSVNGKTGDVLVPIVNYVNGIAPDAHGNVTLPEYVLPIATAKSLGGVIVGDTLKVTDTGLITNDFVGPVTNINGSSGDVTLIQYTLPPATREYLGGVKVGSGIKVNDGKISADVDFVEEIYPVLSVNGKTGIVNIGYSLPRASLETLGGVVIGRHLSITEEGVLELNVNSLPPYPTFPVTSVNNKVGHITIDPYTLPIATKERIGGIKVGGMLAINELGILRFDDTAGYTIATKSILGVVKPGRGLSVTQGGRLDVTDLDFLVKTSDMNYGIAKLSESIGLNDNNQIKVNTHLVPTATFTDKGGLLLRGGKDPIYVSGPELHIVRLPTHRDEDGLTMVKLDESFTIDEQGYLRPIARGVTSVNHKYPDNRGNVLLEGFVEGRNMDYSRWLLSKEPPIDMLSTRQVPLGDNFTQPVLDGDPFVYCVQLPRVGNTRKVIYKTITKGNYVATLTTHPTDLNKYTLSALLPTDKRAEQVLTLLKTGKKIGDVKLGEGLEQYPDLGLVPVTDTVVTIDKDTRYTLSDSNVAPITFNVKEGVTLNIAIPNRSWSGNNPIEFTKVGKGNLILQGDQISATPSQQLLFKRTGYINTTASETSKHLGITPVKVIMLGLYNYIPEGRPDRGRLIAQYTYEYLL